jgi:hypothetical protein
MAFYRDALASVGGFDPRYRAAGDDVDVCWRLQDAGHKLGFSPAAMVWHHRRNSVRAYWRQQRGYGRAEALLERKWPERYNRAGHLEWAGRLYGRGITRPPAGARWRVYHGMWGGALFQRLYGPTWGTTASLPLMPEWYLVLGVLACLSVLGAFWAPLMLAIPVLTAAASVVLVQAGMSAREASYPTKATTRRRRIGRWALTALLHVIQPMARLRGRLGHGLTPWRQRAQDAVALPLPRQKTVWCEQWRELAERVAAVESALVASGVAVLRGGDWDRWELEVRGGLLASVRMRSTIEEHGSGRQLLRVRTWPCWSGFGIALLSTLSVLGGLALLSRAWIAGGVLGALAVAVALSGVREAAAGTGTLLHAIPAAALEQPVDRDAEPGPAGRWSPVVEGAAPAYEPGEASAAVEARA